MSTKKKTKVSVASPASKEGPPKAGSTSIGSGFSFKIPEMPTLSFSEPEPEPTEDYPQVAALREVLSILKDFPATRAVWVLRCARLLYPQDPLSLKKNGRFRG